MDLKLRKLLPPIFHKEPRPIAINPPLQIDPSFDATLDRRRMVEASNLSLDSMKEEKKRPKSTSKKKEKNTPKMKQTEEKPSMKRRIQEEKDLSDNDESLSDFGDISSKKLKTRVEIAGEERFQEVRVRAGWRYIENLEPREEPNLTKSPKSRNQKNLIKRTSGSRRQSNKVLLKSEKIQSTKSFETKIEAEEGSFTTTAQETMSPLPSTFSYKCEDMTPTSEQMKVEMKEEYGVHHSHTAFNSFCSFFSLGGDEKIEFQPEIHSQSDWKKLFQSIEKKALSKVVDRRRGSFLYGDQPLKILKMKHRKKDFHYLVEWKTLPSGFKPGESYVTRLELLMSNPLPLLYFYEGHLKPILFPHLSGKEKKEEKISNLASKVETG